MRTRLELQRAQRKLEGREAREFVSRESVRRSMGMRVGEMVGDWAYISVTTVVLKHFSPGGR